MADADLPRLELGIVCPVTASKLFDYDVAFSFLFRDLAVAKDLTDRLPGLRVFIFDRYKEELLGGDGMDRFGDIFANKTRLTVILYREGWGETPWTAYEEWQIKSRALLTQMTSFMIVRLDDAPLRKWMPTSHLFASPADSRDEQAAIIRARTRELGATTRTLSASEKALERVRAENAARAREERMHSASAASEIADELQTLFSQLVKAANEISAGGEPTLQLKAGYTRDACVISNRRSVSLYLQQVGNTLRGRVLRVNWWDAPHELPSERTPPHWGNRHAGADIYRPIVSEENEWVWEWDPNFEQHPGFHVFMLTSVYRTPELVDAIIAKLMDKIYER